MKRAIIRGWLVGFLALLLVAVVVACAAEPEAIEVTRVVEVTRIVKVPRALAEVKEIEVTRVVEAPVEIAVPVEITRVEEIIVEVEVTRLVAELLVTRVVEVPVEVEVTRIVTVIEEVLVEVPAGSGPAAPDTAGFLPTASLNAGRHNHTASLLADGRVLVAGGALYGWQGPSFASTEIYDPRSQTWQIGPTLDYPRQDHTATALPDGRIFVTGGTQPGPSWQDSTEMLNPGQMRWQVTAALAFPRSMHSATLLPGGQILVLGGWTGSRTLAHAELYDPAKDTWQQAVSLNEARHDHSATLLPDGRVLVVGGYREQGGAQWLDTAEIYDPTSGVSTPTAPLFCHGTSHRTALLADGRVLVMGGACGGGRPGIVDDSEIFDPATDTWLATAPMAEARFGMGVSRLSNGNVLVTGGGDGDDPLASVELFNPLTETWSYHSPLNTARAAHTSTLLPDGRLLISGGWAGDTQTLSSSELLTPTN